MFQTATPLAIKMFGGIRARIINQFKAWKTVVKE